MNRKERVSFPGVGPSSLLVIFAVLALVVFSLLAVSTAQADERLSRQHKDTILGYYQAELEADMLIARLRTGEISPGVTGENGVYSFRCPVSGTQVLEVQVRITGENYEILRWQTVSATAWQTDEKLPVWDGQG